MKRPFAMISCTGGDPGDRAELYEAGDERDGPLVVMEVFEREDRCGLDLTPTTARVLAGELKRWADRVDPAGVTTFAIPILPTDPEAEARIDKIVRERQRNEQVKPLHVGGARVSEEEK